MRHLVMMGWKISLDDRCIKLMSKKIAIGGAAVALLGVSWAGTTWYSSQQFEPMYQSSIKEFNQTTLSPVVLKLTSFQQGFFQSRANWEISLNTDPCQPSKTMVLTGYDIIQHGFVPSLGWASIDTHVIWPDVIDSKLKQVFGQQEALSIHSKVSLLGNISTTIKSPKAHWQGETLQANWQGLNGKLKFSDHRQQVEFDVRVPEVNVSTVAEKRQLFAVSELRYQGERQAKPSLLPLGKAEFSVGQLQAGSAQTQVLLDHITMSSKNELNQKQISAHINYAIGNIQINKKPIGDFKAGVLLEHISEQAAQQTYQALSKLQQQCRPNGQAMMAAVAPLLEHGFQLRLDEATLNAFKGVAQANALFTMQPTPKARQLDPKALLQQLSASGRIKLSEQLLTGAIETISGLKGEQMSKAEATQMVAVMMQGLLQQGYVVKTSTGYQAAMALQQGRASINGKAVGQLPVGASTMGLPSSAYGHEVQEVGEDNLVVDPDAVVVDESNDESYD